MYATLTVQGQVSYVARCAFGAATPPGISLLRYASHVSSTGYAFSKISLWFKLFKGSEGLGLQAISGQREKRQVLHVVAAWTLIVFMDRLPLEL